MIYSGRQSKGATAVTRQTDSFGYHRYRYLLGPAAGWSVNDQYFFSSYDKLLLTGACVVCIVPRP